MNDDLKSDVIKLKSRLIRESTSESDLASLNLACTLEMWLIMFDDECDQILKEARIESVKTLLDRMAEFEL